MWQRASVAVSARHQYLFASVLLLVIICAEAELICLCSVIKSKIDSASESIDVKMFLGFLKIKKSFILFFECFLFPVGKIF